MSRLNSPSSLNRGTWTKNLRNMPLVLLITTFCVILATGPPCVSGEVGNGIDGGSSRSVDGGEGVKSVFVREPEDVWVVKSGGSKGGLEKGAQVGAEVFCSAVGVIKVVFYCDGVPVSKKNQVTTTDDVSKQTNSFITFSRDEVVDGASGDVLINKCYCSVYVSVSEERKSRTATIRVASLKKDFLSDPISKRVAVGSPVELQCRPPEGEPKPEVYWLKDGAKVIGSRFVVGEQYPTLMITEATFADTGEYICVAKNVFTQRESYPAKLDVYEDGGWSDWSRWSECSSECGKGTLSRSRSCNNPPPVNGADCEGKSDETADCTIVCQDPNSVRGANGGWGEWGPWSPCSQKCGQVRRRDCAVRRASGGGVLKTTDSDQGAFSGSTPCQGESVEHRNCSGDYCTFISLGTAPPKRNNKPAQPVQESNLALYFGLITIVGLFIIVVLVIVFFIQRMSKYGVICGGHSLGGPQGAGGAVSYMSHEPYHTEALAMSGKYREGPQYPAGHYTMQSSYHPNNFALSSSTGNSLSNGTHLYSSAAGGNFPHPSLTFPNGGLVSPITSCTAPIASSQVTNGGSVPVGNFFLMPAAQYGLFQGDLVPTSKMGMNNPESPKSYHMGPGSEKNGYTLGVQLGPSGNPTFLPFMGPHSDRASMMMDHYEDLPEDVPLALAQEYQMKALQNQQMIVPHFADYAINIEPHCIARGKVGFAGGRLCIPDSKVSLLIPEGAVPRGAMQDVYIAVCRDERQIPSLADKPKSTLLSPVIMAGPPGLKFNKPVVLSFEHSARGSMFDWFLKVLSGPNWSDTISVSDSSSQNSGSQNNNNNSSSPTGEMFCQVDPATCYLMSDTVRGQYALIGGQQNAATLVIKSLRCVTFCCLPPKNSSGTTQELTFRVYCIPNYRDTWEFVNELERQFGGTLVCESVDLDLVSYSEPLKIALGDLSSGWITKSTQQEIPFDHLWNKVTCHTQHASFALLRHKKDASLESLSFNVKVSQGSFQHNFKSLAIKMTSAHLNSVNNTLPIFDHSNETNSGVANSDSSGSADNSRNLSAESASMFVFRLSHEVRQRMIETFDKNHGKNWYHLAAMLKLDQFQTYFATKTSPTEHILDLWEARHRDRNSIGQLVDILKSLGQFEIATLIEHDLAEWL